MDAISPSATLKPKEIAAFLTYLTQFNAHQPKGIRK